MSSIPAEHESARTDLSATLATLKKNATANGLEPLDFSTVEDLCELSQRDDDELKALLIGLFLALKEGSACLEISRETLLRRFKNLLNSEAANTLVDAILQKFEQDGFEQLIGKNATESRPVIRQKRDGKTRIYFQKYLKHERVLQELLMQRLENSDALCMNSDAALAQVKTIVQEVLTGAGRPTNWEFSDEQKLAIALAMLRNFVVISGGPGTGKTSIVFALLCALLRSGTELNRIALACPTGRAAQRLTDSIRGGVLSLAENIGDAQKLSALSAKTLHRLLGYRPSSGTFSYHRENLLPYDVVIVDELSMVDMVMMSRLLEALPPQAKLILLGDPNQLPSVDAGSVLSDLMPPNSRTHFSASLIQRLKELSGLKQIDGEVSPRTLSALTDSCVVLQKNHRSQPHIRDVAAAINALPKDPLSPAIEAIVDALPRVKLERVGDVPVWPELESFSNPAGSKNDGGGCWFLEELSTQPDTSSWKEIVTAWATHHYLKSGYFKLAAQTLAPTPDATQKNSALSQLFQRLNRARILTLVREGPYGCTGINQRVAQTLRPGERTRRGELFSGAPVLITSNNYALEVFNGDVGVALPSFDDARSMQVVFERQDAHGQRRYVSIPVSALPAHELAFALTVHKSQGSEYGEVLLALPQEGAERLLNRQLLYTAITRSQDLAVIYGTATALSAAIAQTLERTSGLNLNS